ncbi:aminopeptidase P N-terminal domain-containing protein [Halorhodospira halochloris]|uniref:Xaa-Pro aminopeptidase n=1 Tax=Halorhodospira halochloris TaxID=1052 RepID=A0A120MZL0_HALHR|nr:aminopeptidase P N-terminal domain-containing protein [Halorhodospira halochloris]MBK1650794.1 Xaa-Pro aminopeptidase [Halorhodospira halochloris]MCG5530233.1 aminopeptidase P N-terminal domain-containing protein [Halorhodospira halochloris]MCG5547147.1 aminopeptidase P N-terminal domain-containing protein [Halorhodospira halochloris]BAU56708.1 Xaa-Pro aminopeptidase [Halorhodospira halochloris]
MDSLHRKVSEKRRQALLNQCSERQALIIPAASEKTRNRDVEHVFRQDSDFLYLTGFPEPDAVAVLLPNRAGGEFILFVRERDPEQERWSGKRYGTEDAKELFGADQAYPLAEIGQKLPELLVGREIINYPIGRDEHGDRRMLDWFRSARRLCRATQQPPVCIQTFDNNIHSMRLIKSAEELDAMHRAAGVTVSAHRRAMQVAQPAMPEYELAAEILAIFHRHGGEAAYPSIVAGGANACTLHYVTNRELLRDGDLVLIDAGAELDGYAADITRTFPVNGRFSGEQRAVYEIVLAAQQAAIEEVCCGRTFDDFHQRATRVLVQGMVDLDWLSGDIDNLIERGEHRRFYPHRTGHWLGMDVHDVGPLALEGKWQELQEGMVVTVEPGLYCPPGSTEIDERWRGIGVRIEDDVAVTANLPWVLTEGVPKNPVEVEAMMSCKL